MIPLLLLMYMAPASPHAVQTTDPKYCSKNTTCFTVSYDPNVQGARIAADEECSRASFEAAKKTKNRDVSCVSIPLAGDVFNATETNGTPLATRSQPAPIEGGGVKVPTTTPRTSRTPQQVPNQPVTPNWNRTLGRTLKAAVDKGDCRVSNFSLECPGFIADIEKDRLDRDPKHDGTFEDSPVKLYPLPDPDEHPEKFLKSTTLCSALDVMRELDKNYETANPIRIVKLPNPDRKDTYLILLSGSEFGNLDQATGIITDARLAKGEAIRYSYELLKAAKSTIPKGSRVILAGHSLGGMAGEKAVSDPEWQRLFRTTDVITFGSPQVAGADVVGTRYTRFWAAGDPVPAMTIERRYRENNYKMIPGKSDPFEAHKSYKSSPDLATYDALGQLGNACLTVDATQTWRFKVTIEGDLR